MDLDKTGNFEVKMHSKEDLSDQGKPIYSKKLSGKFPTADAQELYVFEVNLKAAMV